MVPNDLAAYELKGKLSLLLHLYSHSIYNGGTGSTKSKLKLLFRKEEKEMHPAAPGLEQCWNPGEVGKPRALAEEDLPF